MQQNPTKLIEQATVNGYFTSQGKLIHKKMECSTLNDKNIKDASLSPSSYTKKHNFENKARISAKSHMQIKRPITESRKRKERRRKLIENLLSMIQKTHTTKQKIKEEEKMAVIGNEVRPTDRLNYEREKAGKMLDQFKRKILLQLITNNKIKLEDLKPLSPKSSQPLTPEKITNFIINNYDIIIQKANENIRKQEEQEIQKEISQLSSPYIVRRIFDKRSYSYPKKKPDDSYEKKILSKLPNIYCSPSASPTPGSEYSSHAVNVSIKCINEAIYSLTKSKDVTSFIANCRQIGIKISKKEFPIKAKEFVLFKDMLLRKLYSTILYSNGQCKEIGVCKYFVAPGNNSELVKNLLKNRWWMIQLSESESKSANFYWSPWKKESFTSTMTSNLTNGIPKLCNHLPQNYQLGNKKDLYWNMKRYFSSVSMSYTNYMPLTYNIKGNDARNERNVAEILEKVDYPELLYV
jgi:hypothetical protein